MVENELPTAEECLRRAAEWTEVYERSRKEWAEQCEEWIEEGEIGEPPKVSPEANCAEPLANLYGSLGQTLALVEVDRQRSEIERERNEIERERNEIMKAAAANGTIRSMVREP